MCGGNIPENTSALTEVVYSRSNRVRPRTPPKSDNGLHAGRQPSTGKPSERRADADQEQRAVTPQRHGSGQLTGKGRVPKRTERDGRRIENRLGPIDIRTAGIHTSVPIRAWRVHATASELYRMVGRSEEAVVQRERALAHIDRRIV
jgi:hypothetical protein